MLVRSGANFELFRNDGSRTALPITVSAGTGASTLSDTGRRLAVQTSTGVRIFDTNSWKESNALPATGLVSIAFGAGGSRLLTAGTDAVVRVWDVSRQKEIARFLDFKHVRALALTPEGSVSVVQHFRVMNNPFLKDQIRKDLCDRVSPIYRRMNARSTR